MPARDAAFPAPNWDELIPRLVAYARACLWYVRTGKGDYEDAVTSTVRTYLRHKQACGEPIPSDGEELWAELRPHLRRKVGYGRSQQNFAQNRPERLGWEVNDLAADAPVTPERVEEFVKMAMQTLAEQIDDEQLLQIARLRLEGYRVREIAAELELSEDQVSRRLSRIRRLLHGEFGDGEVSDAA